MMLDSTSVKGRILDAAARAFATHGVDQTSIDDIARDLGATKGKIYQCLWGLRHFPIGHGAKPLLK